MPSKKSKMLNLKGARDTALTRWWKSRGTRRQHIARAKEGPVGHQKHSDTVAQIVGMIYSILLVALGLILPIGFYLSKQSVSQNAYIITFYLYLYLVSLAFMVYLIVGIVMYTRQQEKERAEQIQRSLPGLPGLPNGAIGSSRSRNTQRRKMTWMKPRIAFVGQGVTVYLRLGTVVFSLGSAILWGLEMSELSRDDVWSCYNGGDITSSIVKQMYITVQTLFIYKYHKLVLNYHVPMMKLGMVHMMATNMCMWATTVVYSAAEKVVEHGNSIVTGNAMQANHTTSDPHAENGINHVTVSPDLLTTTHRPAYTCMSADTAFHRASNYFYPFLIVFSIISTAILFRIYANIGAWVHPYYKDYLHRKNNERQKKKKVRHMNIGVVIGLLLVALVLLLTVAFHSVSQGEDGYLNTGAKAEIYTFVDLVLNLVALGVVCVAFTKTTKLRVIGNNNPLDQTLSIVTIAGYYFLMAFIAVAAAALTQKKFNHFGYLPGIVLFSSFVTIIETSVQMLFVIDGLHRHAMTKETLTEKPGRALITLLLLINVALWIANTFMWSPWDDADMMYHFYGPLTWIVITSIFRPLVIFFRFHASGCLAEMWLKGYQEDFKLSKILCKKTHNEHLFQVLSLAFTLTSGLVQNPNSA